MKLTINELWVVLNDAMEYYKEVPSTAKLEGMDRKLSGPERIGLSYMHATIQHLKRTGAIPLELDAEVLLTSADSKTGG